MMKKAILTFTLIFTAFVAQAKTLTVGIDLSGSNPLLAHKNFAHIASQYVSDEINKLNNGDTVNVKTFGSRAAVENLLNTSFQISRRMKPAKVSGVVTQYIQSLPEKVDVAQSSTNLVAWLEFTSGFNCTDAGQILVVTDGIESSTYVEGDQFIHGKKELPKPDVDLKGCSLTFYGLGAGLHPQAVRNIRNEWIRWSEQAGAIFTAVIP